ncbi:MAG: hypothetical protein IT430_02870 [Phycisphaerales bacterium]|nr:hypothetical protein [Phycisphaerales bacterium]
MAVFIVRQTGERAFYFAAYAIFGPRLVQSGVYSTREATIQAVKNCRSLAADEAHYQRHDPGPDKHYFDMTDTGSAYLATSDTFSTARRRDETLSYCRERLPIAGMADETVASAGPG